MRSACALQWNSECRGRQALHFTDRAGHETVPRPPPLQQQEALSHCPAYYILRIAYFLFDIACQPP
jgi:hypothetical protein